MTAVMVVYYAFAVGLIYAVGCFTYRKTSRELTKQTDEMIARMQEHFGRYPPLEPHVPQPLPDDDSDTDEEYADTIASVRDQLAELADHGYPVAAALKEVDALARQVGV